MECIEIELFKCPKCNKVLKPSTMGGKLEITEYTKKTVKKIEILDILICRYCNIFVKVENLRKSKDPIAFLQEFIKIPENTEIRTEEKYNIRLREEHKENMEKYNHSHPPDKCPDCNSEDIIADSCDHGWICMSCESYFQWEKYLVMFHGDIEVYARDGDEAIEKGYYALEKKRVDIEADWM